MRELAHEMKTGRETTGLKTFNFWMGPRAVAWFERYPLRNCSDLRPTRAGRAAGRCRRKGSHPSARYVTAETGRPRNTA